MGRDTISQDETGVGGTEHEDRMGEGRQEEATVQNKATHRTGPKKARREKRRRHERGGARWDRS